MTNTLKLLPPFPSGWYVVALSRDLKPAGLQTLKFMGEETILFRTQSGIASLMEAYCPHLGAHLGYGGRVVGETIRCPFHAFQYDVSGACISTAYGTRIPPKARARVFPVQESHGLILAYFDPAGQPPAWQIPALDTAGWSNLLCQRWDFLGHPQETTENSVDLGHFSIIHGYSDVSPITELATQGPYLSAKYKMTRDNSFFGLPVTTEFTIHVYGLGYSQVDIFVPKIGLRGRLFVLATPTDGQNITLRAAVSGQANGLQPGNLHPLLGLIPRPLMFQIGVRRLFTSVCHDVSQDFVIWQHKRYVQPPILAEGDGPIGKYRQWAKQFYLAQEMQ